LATAPPAAASVRVIELPTNDIVYDPFTDLIYAAVPSSAGFPRGNSITPIDPHTAAIGESVFVGSEPGPLALADDGSLLYVGFDTTNRVLPFDPLTQSAAADPFEIGPSNFRVEDMVVVPGNADSLAIARRHTSGSPYNKGVAIFVDGVKLPVDTNQFENQKLANAITYSDSPEVLYGHDSGISPHTNLITFDVDLSPEGGVTAVKTTGGVFGVWQPDIQFDAGKVYSTRGGVVDPVEHDPLGSYDVPWYGGTFVPDSWAGMTYYQFDGKIHIFDQPTFLLRGGIDIPDFTGEGFDLIRWGRNGLAFRTDEKLYLVDSAAVGGPASLAALASGDWHSAGTWNGNGRIPTRDFEAVVDGQIVTLTRDGTAGSIAIRGDGAAIVVGDGRTLAVGGHTTMGPNSQYISRLGDTAAGRIAAAGDVQLGGALALQVDNVGDPGATRRTILTSAGPGGFAGTFDDLPPGHLGLGVFFRGIDYAAVDPDTETAAVAVDLFTAGGGDGNGDGRVDGQDITQLISRFTRPGDPADRTWTDNDTDGGPLGRGDGNVDGQDITDLIIHFTGDPGPSDGATQTGTAAAEYNPATGAFRVSVDGVLNWTLSSDEQFTGPGMSQLADVLPLGSPANLASANVNTIGEGGFSGTMTYGDVELGQLAEAGTDAGRFTLTFVTAFGTAPQTGTIHVVPEPSTLALLLAGLLGLTFIRRRR